jgi:serine/threonine-protein kinase
MADKTLVGRAVDQHAHERAAHADTLIAPSEPVTKVDVGADPFVEGTRYAVRNVIGAGGMGEVRLCADRWIGRNVAMKVVRQGTGSASETRGRFLREARVQGQLEHPSIVPVYDIGRTPEGEAFFTMKRIGGATLEQIVTGLREGDPAMVAAYGRRKLLSAMSQVCLTVAYAHSRGVVHRDLKPANVMLGDFGEVYVLDWGVARVAGVPDPSGGGAISGEETTDLARTQEGALVGTPGFMVPEQARGEVDAIGPASDVYALGVMLFELLVLEPLYRGDTLTVLIASS